MSRPLRALAILATVLLAPGCGGADRQSALDPAGVQAERIHGLGQLYFWVAVAVYVAVMGFVVAAVLRRGHGGPDHPLTAPPLAGELRKGVAVASALVATALILFVLL